jgi:hypothetical protein
MVNRNVTGRMFVEWARTDLKRWAHLKGRHIVHRRKGVAKCVDVRREAGCIVVGVEFPGDETRDYLDRFFAGTFVSVRLAPHLSGIVRSEVSARQEDELGRLQEKIRAKRVLEEKELRWLGENEHVAELEQYLEIHGKEWPVAKVGAYWRQSAMPERNVQVTGAIEQGESTQKTHGPVWTTRGAAFADLEDMDDAERCAKKGVGCDRSSYYPWNLLGRIYRYLGEHDRAEDAFKKAKDLGSSDKSQRSSDLRGRHGRLRDSDRQPPSTPADPRDDDLEEVPF